MSVLAYGQWALPDTPYALWARGELAEYLHVPDDGTRVEVIGGEFVVSPAPVYPHAGILTDISDAFGFAKRIDPGFRWRSVQTVNLDLISIGDGYIPDMVVVDRETDLQSRADEVLHVYPEQLQLVVEVTSQSNARSDREPVLDRRPTKWSGYARCGVPFYLLVDRDPRRPGVTLFGAPDRAAGRYEVLESWKLGDPLTVPEPFGVEIDTGLWRPWSD
ncbi:Uma2 family endonuclease [Kitasatospora viridis]|uniref:Putative restriction endonuclease n=1 Tax=Kitasatospora viridis TaxID=281105 RepID=A0A561UDG9_9ACTN|nr:Uma2 family endonuclease [Kitasatospora viridis]TWF97406.1 putative restriction endonuclease [Kitasatospora viridis]